MAGLGRGMRGFSPYKGILGPAFTLFFLAGVFWLIYSFVAKEESPLQGPLSVQNERRIFEKGKGTSTVSSPAPRPHSDRLSRKRMDAGGGVPLALVSSTAGSPIAGGVIKYTLSSLGKKGTLKTNLEGMAFLPAPGKYFLRIQAGGFAGISGSFEIGKEGLRIPLDPAGAMELFFHTENGAPVKGVVACILPPLQAGRYSGIHWREWVLNNKEKRNLISRSSQDGIIVWKGLKPGDGYRWGLLSPRLSVKMTPPNKKADVIPTSNGFISTGSRPEGLSGKIRILPGRITKIRVTVFKDGSVSGVLLNGGAWFERPPHVKLFKIWKIEKPGCPGLLNIESEKVVRANGRGEFHFSGVSPGQKYIQANCRGPGNNFFFFSIDFTLASGEEKDLGAISPRKGETLKLVVRFEGLDGRVIPAREIFGDDENLAVKVAIDSRTLPRKRDYGVHSRIVVKPGEEIFLHGLPRGKLWIRSELGANCPVPRGMFRLKGDVVVKKRLPVQGTVVLPILVERLVESLILIPCSGEGYGRNAELHMLSIETRKDYRFRAFFREKPRGFSAKVLVPSGKYHVLVYPSKTIGGKTKKVKDWYCLSLVEIVPQRDSVVRLELRRGSCLVGSVKDNWGKNLAGQILVFAPGPWGEEKPFRFCTYKCKTDGKGRFVIHGMIPGVEVLAAGPFLSVQKFISGEAGTTKLVEFRRGSGGNPFGAFPGRGR